MTKIQWTDATWNPTRGCSRVSPGCENCYAERQAARFSGPGQPYEGLVRLGPNGPRWTGKMHLVRDKLAEPLAWKKPRKVFVNSMSDLFHESLSDEEIAAVFGVMAAAPQHTFQCLTKRAERMAQWFETMGADPHDRCLAAAAGALDEAPQWNAAMERLYPADGPEPSTPGPWPLPNVWLGVSVEDQRRADERIPRLLRVPAAVRFLSIEPLLGAVDLSRALPCLPPCGPPIDHGPSIEWVIVGGESGPGARPFNVDWARSIVRQCKAAGTACFVKQLGAMAMEDTLVVGRSYKVGNILPLRDRKGGDPLEWPLDLRVREWPQKGA